jgi:hypothetical protein
MTAVGKGLVASGWHTAALTLAFGGQAMVTESYRG